MITPAASIACRAPVNSSHVFGCDVLRDEAVAGDRVLHRAAGCLNLDLLRGAKNLTVGQRYRDTVGLELVVLAAAA